MRGGVRRRRAGRRSIAGEGLDDDDDEDEDEDEDDEDDGRSGGVLGGGGVVVGLAPGFTSAAFLVLTRCVYPGLARALMLEAASLAMHATPSFVVDVLAVVGGVCLPASRVAYRCWCSLARPGIAVLERFTPRGAHTRRGGGGPVLRGGTRVGEGDGRAGGRRRRRREA